MTKIEFKIDGQVITKKNDKTVVEKSRNEYTAVFDFDDTWTDVENKQAYFTRYKDGLCVKADIDESGTCQVPWEVIEMPMFYVSVAGGNLKTVTRESVFVEQTGYRDDAEKSGTVPEVIRTPQSISLQDGMLLLLDKNGEAVGNGVTLPKQKIDEEMSDTSENPVQNKVAKAYTDEKTPTDLTLTDNLLQLTANGSPVGVGVKIKEEWELIDELIVETNEEPVASWFIDLIGRGYKQIWVTGELYSSDTTTATQTISIGGGSASGTYGGTYVQINGTGFTGGRKNYISAFLTLTPIDTIIGEISIGTNAASNANGGYIKNCGNIVGSKFPEIPRPMMKFGSASQQFAAGTKLQMWGCK